MHFLARSNYQIITSSQGRGIKVVLYRLKGPDRLDSLNFISHFRIFRRNNLVKTYLRRIGILRKTFICVLNKE